MMRIFRVGLFVVMAAAAFGHWLSQGMAVEYSAEIQDQIKQIQTQYQKNMGLEYFHDMGIVARKADEAELTEINTKIVRNDLMKPMSAYVEQEITQINELYAHDAYKASEHLAALNRFERYYQPTEEYLNTAAGKALAGELVLMQKNTLENLSKACVDLSLQQGIKTIRSTGLFQTNRAEEINNLRNITREVDCCLVWKKQIHHEHEQPFETDYESGTLTETADLKLQSNARNMSEARWSGEWVYKFKGRDGVGEGVSQALLTYKRGSETAELFITASKVTSAGRINFPRSLAGEPRTLDIKGKPLLPYVVISGQRIDLAGCKDKG